MHTGPRPGVTPAVRFRNPDAGQVVVDDLVHGRVVFENAELDDLVIMRSDGTPTYNFGVVVDDADMRITHVIRGDDHLNNTPKQINLFRALGYETPHFAHIPMIAGPDGAKLSKRHGAVSALEYRELGYLPVAVLNYLARLGWSHGDQEIFSRDELTRLFDLGSVQRSAARFDLEKLNWLNQHYIKETPAPKLAAELAPHLRAVGVADAPVERIEAVANAFRDRSKTLREMAEKARVYLTDEVKLRAEGRAEASAAGRRAAVACGAGRARRSRQLDRGGGSGRRGWCRRGGRRGVRQSRAAAARRADRGRARRRGLASRCGWSGASGRSRGLSGRSRSFAPGAIEWSSRQGSSTRFPHPTRSATSPRRSTCSRRDWLRRSSRSRGC